ncbi:hypothetical protein N8084_01735 [Pelagibacteraceae bacterium]|nr:hypothetical protein [Pelagibacteraceae bacterium]
MKISEFIKKIRRYSFISFLIPLIAINSCLFFYKMLGDIDPYENLVWDKKEIEYSYKEFLLAQQSYSFINCPKYQFDDLYKDKNNQTLKILNDTDVNNIKSILITSSNKINNKCVKNKKIYYIILSNFSLLEKVLLSAKKENKSGFALTKNPYLYGEVSISRSARFFPATLIFQPLLIVTSFFLFLYWSNNLSLFKEFKNKNIINKFSKKFFYFGLLSCMFLMLHASLFSLETDTKIFRNIRRLIIILFIIFEVCAQIYLTINLIKLKKNLNNYVNPLMINIKVLFVSTILIVTLFSFSYLIWGDASKSTIHIMEWNYFSILLLYYLLSRLLWKIKTKVHTPEGV